MSHEQPRSGKLDPRGRNRWILVALVLLAFWLRLPRDGAPPGLYRDEAVYGLDALSTAVHGPRMWYPANNGREPLFIWLSAPFAATLGATPAAVRLPSALIGACAVAAVAALARAMLGALRSPGGAMRASTHPRRGAHDQTPRPLELGVTVAAAVVAVAPWPVWLGRIGFRAGLLPLVLAAAGAASVIGWRRAVTNGGESDASAVGWLIFGGGLAGAAHGTYTAALAAPLAAGVWLVWMGLAGIRRGVDRASRRARLGQGRRGPAPWLAAWLVPWAVGAAAVALAAHLDGMAPWTRALQVAAGGTAPGATGMDASGAWLVGFWRTAGLVFVEGDMIPRHQMPGRPFLAPVAAGLWLVGAWHLRTAITAPRTRDGAVSAALLAWLVAMALPTALAEDAPHFLRAVGLLPALAVILGLGASSVWWATERPRRPSLRRAARTLAGAWIFGALLLELAGSLHYDAILDRGRAADPLAARAAIAAEAAEALGAAAPQDPERRTGLTSDGGSGHDAPDLATRWSVLFGLRPRSADGPPPDDLVAWRDVYFAFEAGASHIARGVARDTGVGWRGGWNAEPPVPDGRVSERLTGQDRARAHLAAAGVQGVRSDGAGVVPDLAGGIPRVWLDRRLRDGWASVAYLAPIEWVTLTDPYDPVLGETGDTPTGRPVGAAYLVPGGLELERVWSALPPDRSVELQTAAWERSDRAPRARRMAIRVAPQSPSEAAGTGSPVARFSGGPTLLAARRTPAGDLRLSWQRRADTSLAIGTPQLALGAVPRSSDAVVRPGWMAPLGLAVFPPYLWQPRQTVALSVPWYRAVPAGEGGAQDIPPVALQVPDGPWLSLEGSPDMFHAAP